MPTMKMHREVEKKIADMHDELVEIKETLRNGFSTKMKFLERMQWWQLGVMVAIIAMLLGGLWYLYTTGEAQRIETIQYIRQLREVTGK